MTDEHTTKRTGGLNMIGALAFGIGGGVIGAVAWFAVVALTKVELGLVAVVVGYLVGRGVVAGSGHQFGMRLQVLSVLITLTAMSLAEYLIVRQAAVGYIGTTYGPSAAGAVPVFLPPSLAWDLTMAGIQDNPMTLLFWGIALWTAFRLPRASALAAQVTTPAQRPAS